MNRAQEKRVDSLPRKTLSDRVLETIIRLIINFLFWFLLCILVRYGFAWLVQYTGGTNTTIADLGSLFDGRLVGAQTVAGGLLVLVMLVIGGISASPYIADMVRQCADEIAAVAQNTGSLLIAAAAVDPAGAGRRLGLGLIAWMLFGVLKTAILRTDPNTKDSHGERHASEDGERRQDQPADHDERNGPAG